MLLFLAYLLAVYIYIYIYIYIYSIYYAIVSSLFVSCIYILSTYYAIVSSLFVKRHVSVNSDSVFLSLLLTGDKFVDVIFTYDPRSALQLLSHFPSLLASPIHTLGDPSSCLLLNVLLLADFC